MKVRTFISVFALLLFFANAEAQPGWKWPDDATKAETAREKNALYSDALKSKMYRQSADHLSWLLINAPDLNESLYINGFKIYDELASETKDAAKKKVYQDSAIIMYDLRIKYFNEKASVLNRKAFSAYKYYRDNPPKYKELVDLFKEAIELNGDKIWDNNILAYFDIVRRYQAETNAFANDQILETYGKVEDLLDAKLAQGSDAEKIEMIRGQVENMLVGMIEVDCNFITNTLAPKFKSNPEIKLAKTILRLSVAGKCLEESPISIEAAKYIFENDKKEYAIAKLIASNCYSSEDFECAENYYQQAAELANDAEDKADAYLSLANTQLKMGKKSSARDFAKKALSADPSNKNAASFIAALYMNSFNDCKQGKDPVQDRALFIAAYNWYQKAGDSQGMANAKEQFPSMEEIFTWNYKLGQQVNVGCWINETVELKKRD